MSDRSPITKLAREMGVRHTDRLEPLTDKARTALNRVLRDLNGVEASALVISNGFGRWDWHMVDGERRVWHFTVTGRTAWNMLSDRDLDRMLGEAERLLGREITGE
jgi:hypothetical protein